MRKSPINALFPKARQGILAATYGQPEKWWFQSEIAAFLETTPSSLQRELKSLSASGILRERRDGSRLYFQAETDSPIFIPLRDLIEQTLGVTESIKEAVNPFADKINCAFVYGSVARQEEGTLSDVDLIVVGEIGLSELSSVLRRLERKFNREINATSYRTAEFAKKVKSGNHFLTSVLKTEKIFLVGNENELDNIIDKPNGAESHDQPSRNRKPARTRRA